MTHPHDDVAANIRNEMMADAMPTKEEAQADYRRHLAKEGCAVCGEDDPDMLDTYYEAYPSCSWLQSPERLPVKVLCDEHSDAIETLRERALKQAHKRNGQPYRDEETVAIAHYECGNYEFVEEEEHDDEVIRAHYETPPIPSARIECYCGAHLAEVVHLDDESDPEQEDGDVR